VAIIPLGPSSLAGSSHLPATYPSRVAGRLFGVAPRRDCPFHPRRFALRRIAGSACAPPTSPSGAGSACAPPTSPSGAGSACAPPTSLSESRLTFASRPSSIARLCGRRSRCDRKSAETRLCCSDPHLTVGRCYLLRRSAESGLSSGRQGLPAIARRALQGRNVRAAAFRGKRGGYRRWTTWPASASSACRRSAMLVTGRISCTAPAAIASFGIPKTTQLASSCAML